MNDIPVNNWAVGLAIFSFGFLTVGSVLFGATVITSVLRGLSGGILFGSLIWLAGVMISQEKKLMGQTMLEEEGIPDLETTPIEAKQMATRDK